ncbi:E3 ubiquitin-protein ligase TRIM33 [Agrilus planipennis]|uniref:E3 ubiquitin-protein ligase TRIM33 n=1 Tax=Agrilus planipennis TaxID=224129 RepID=A0A1W4X2Z3_AGRPL|nr:E3 ubiquitin-protein ligase TRIM33 [Agrilus planipennis]
MAEADFKLSDQDSIQNNSNLQNNSESKDSDPSENPNISSVNVENIAVIDNAIEEVLNSTKEDSNQDQSNNLTNSSEEENVESGTSGDSFVYKCVFCERILTASDEPKLLECLHNVCGSCVNNKICEQSESNIHGSSIQTVLIPCASCNLPSQVERIIENQFLLEFSNHDDNIAKATEIKCSSCSDDALAVSWCADCLEYICESCVQAHQRLKITKDHTIKTKEEGLLENHTSTNASSNQNLMCSVHPHEKLSLFCENCDKLTCRDCQLIEHRDHKYKFTHEIASDTRKFISNMLKDVSYKRVLLDSAMKVIADRQTLISEKKQAIVKEITQMVVKLTNTINMRGKELVSKLNEVCEQKQKTLQEKKVALDQLSKITDHCIEFTQHALESGSDMALLFSKRQVTCHLQRIKCKRADIPNPEIPVRIHLALDKVPELIKVISTIGQIVVDGRVYPISPSSPAGSLPPHGSPSPGHTRPPQQQSPLNQPPPPSSIQQPPPQQPQHYQQQQMTFQQPRMLPPPYGQQHYQQTSQSMQPGMQQNMNQKIQQNMPPQLNTLPMTLQQHLQQSPMQRVTIPRGGMPRAILPINRLSSPGINHQQQQVSSSTHPQGLMQERGSLRGLLQPTTNHNSSTVYVQTGPNQYRAVQPQFAQQYQNRFNQQQQVQQMRQQLQQPGGSIRLLTSSHLPPNIQTKMNVQNQNFTSPPLQQGAKWHIPQTGDAVAATAGAGTYAVSVVRSQASLPVNDNFKITLKSQANNVGSDTKPAAVSSTIPKTPSPNGVQGGKSDTERNLDKFCQDSVNDLMATIAKLDSNGVQVLAEGNVKTTGGSPHVDSSTDDSGVVGGVLSGKVKGDVVDPGKDDPNEDWCAVCMDGGELVCCDKCPKVFHQFCHIPNLSVEESDTWQCLLCTNIADLPPGEIKEGELETRQRKILERIVLELYCQYEPSLPFREVIGPENIEYHSIIKKPIALDTIRHKLDWNAINHYTTIDDFIKDIRLMFKNAYTYNDENTQVYQDAKTLEKFFDEQLEKFLPEHAYDEFRPPPKKFRRIVSD